MEHPIEILNLSARHYNALLRSGIGALEQLYDKMTTIVPERLLTIRGIGIGAVREIKKKLKEFN